MKKPAQKTSTKKAPAPKVIEETFLKGRQSIEFKGIYELAGFKLKVYIDRDSYDFQSSAAISVWQADKLEWSRVASIHYSQMKSSASYVTPLNELTIEQKASFHQDKQSLINLAKQIIL